MAEEKYVEEKGLFARSSSTQVFCIFGAHSKAVSSAFLMGCFLADSPFSDRPIFLVPG